VGANIAFFIWRDVFCGGDFRLAARYRQVALKTSMVYRKYRLFFI
jgi:hypothetical protein